MIIEFAKSYSAQRYMFFFIQPLYRLKNNPILLSILFGLGIQVSIRYKQQRQFLPKSNIQSKPQISLINRFLIPVFDKEFNLSNIARNLDNKLVLLAFVNNIPLNNLNLLPIKILVNSIKKFINLFLVFL